LLQDLLIKNFLTIISEVLD
jgi:hypothetical protein